MLEAEKQVQTGLYLPLMEDFYTIQGEGYHSGTPSYFIRIGGCDVGCHWCDVKESWNAALHPPTSIEIIAEKAIYALRESKCKTIVITGGEPSTYPMQPLTEKLKHLGFNIHLETSGAYGYSGLWDWICLSPKKTGPPLPDWYAKANELKVIIYNQNDFVWAEEHAKKVSENCTLFLQPEWSRREKMTPQIIEYVMNNPKWSISLQTHKYMNIP